MLKRLSHERQTDTSAFEVKAGSAAFPHPFAKGLEYNAPVHGTWNIVHIGMQVPGAHQIYVCSDNCMRGVVMTADEMGLADRFSCVSVTEKDLLSDNMESITIEGVSDVIRRLPYRPPVVMVFTVCLHLFVGSDLDYIYRELNRRFPDIFFCRCFMDPITQKTSLTPEQKLRKAMFDPLKKQDLSPEGRKTVNILGSDVLHTCETSDLYLMLQNAGFTVRQLQDCRSFEDYSALSDAALNICCYPSGLHGISELSERLGIPWLYLASSFSYSEIKTSEETLAAWIRADLSVTGSTASFPDKARCDEALESLSRKLQNIPVCLDYTAHPRPLSLTRLLLTHGIDVQRVYLDDISAEEEQDLAFLSEHFPELTFCATVRPEMRIQQKIPSEGSPDKILAIGQKAAFFENTPYFVNMVEGGGLWGYAGILALCRQIESALRDPKEIRDTVVRKGLGCDSLCVVPVWQNKPKKA